MTPRLTIAMACRNGAAWLPQQLDSLLAQTQADWNLWVSDDGSTDGTRSLIGAFAAAFPDHRVTLLDGPERGSAANFLHLLCHPDLPPGAVALCDQDDVWLPGKLARALPRIAAEPVDLPVLYAAESWRCHADLSQPRASRPPCIAPSFANALVQNLCAGHTIVLNPAARDLVRRAGIPPGIAFHDWWLYQLVTGAGGRVLLDPLPVALYRQHSANALGAAGDARARLRRAALIAGGTYAAWGRAHRRALAASGVLTPQAQALLAALGDRPGPLCMLRLGLHRDTRLGTAALIAAALLGRA
jgi:glycosyltransferase involved in cell wall biosynthesis